MPSIHTHLHTYPFIPVSQYKPCYIFHHHMFTPYAYKSSLALYYPQQMSKDRRLTKASHFSKTYPHRILANRHLEKTKRTLHDDALLSSIHLSVLIDTSHEFVVSLFGLDFVWEPFLEKGGEFVVEVICYHMSISRSFRPCM
jgi:hypothetical protein